jgi:hypothetical protein
MKKIIVIITLATFVYACSPEKPKSTDTSAPAQNDLLKDDESKKALDAKGIGKFTSVQLSATLDPKLAALGNGIYDLKCSSCHKLTGEKLVGPGWSGVTKRRTVEWVMNFATNTDEMLNKDPEAQALLETCLVRMPNQSLSDDDARNVYEFMRKNDGLK